MYDKNIRPFYAYIHTSENPADDLSRLQCLRNLKDNFSKRFNKEIIDLSHKPIPKVRLINDRFQQYENTSLPKLGHEPIPKRQKRDILDRVKHLLVNPPK